MSNSKEAVALRVAASNLAEGLHAPAVDGRDSSFRRLDSKLQRAAVRYGMAKRGYSREFKPHGDTGKRYLLDKIPAGLWREVQTKAKREGVSIRALILRLLTEWIVDAPKSSTR